MWDLSFQTRDRTFISFVGRRNLNHWATREVPFLALFEEGFEVFNSKATTEEMKYNTTRILIQVHYSNTHTHTQSRKSNDIWLC